MTKFSKTSFSVQGTGEIAVQYDPYQPFEMVRKTVGVDIREPFKEESINFANLGGGHH